MYMSIRWLDMNRHCSSQPVPCSGVSCCGGSTGSCDLKDALPTTGNKAIKDPHSTPACMPTRWQDAYRFTACCSISCTRGTLIESSHHTNKPINIMLTFARHLTGASLPMLARTSKTFSPSFRVVWTPFCVQSAWQRWSRGTRLGMRLVV